MKRNIANKYIVLPSFLVLCLLSPCLTDAYGQEKQPSVADLQAEIKELKKDLKGDFSAVHKDVGELKKSIAELEKTITDHKTTVELRLNAALERIDQLEKTVAKLQGSPHVAERPPDNDEPPKKPVDIKLDPPPEINKIGQVMERLHRLENQVAQMESDLREVMKRPSFYMPEDLDLDDIKGRLHELEKEVTRFRDVPPVVAKSPPPTGTIVLTNVSNEVMLFQVNGVPYRVNPNSFMNLRNQPAGPVAYEVISSLGGGSSGQTVTNLNPGQTLTLTALR